MACSEMKSVFLASVLQLCVSAVAPAVDCVQPENHGNKTIKASVDNSL